MVITTSRPSNSQAVLPLLGRLLVAALFLVSGFGKLQAPAGTMAFIAGAGIPLPMLAYVLALILELAGGSLLVLGLATRPIAAALCLFCLASAVVFHGAVGDQNQLFHFLKNLAVAGGLLQFVAYGAGRLSLDARRQAHAPAGIGAAV